MRFDYRVLKSLARPLYIFNILMLLAVMLVGKSALGAQRWLQLGPISIQPSEFAKAIMIISLSSFVDDRLPLLTDFRSWLPVFGYVLLPFLFVMKQPDLGTSLVFLAILLGTMIVCGFRIRYFLIMGGLGLASAPPGVAAAPRIPAEPDPGIPESRTGTLWQRLPCDPVHDRHRVRAFLPARDCSPAPRAS